MGNASLCYQSMKRRKNFVIFVGQSLQLCPSVLGLCGAAHDQSWISLEVKVQLLWRPTLASSWVLHPFVLHRPCFSRARRSTNDKASLDRESIPARDARAQGQQLFFHALVAALDHVGVLHGGLAAGAQRRAEQRHAGADVG